MNKIGWCTDTINPISGCLNGCPYCYARKMAHRLRGRFGYPGDDPFKPAFHPDKVRDILNLPGYGKRVFLDSMGDWFSPGVEIQWIEEVLRAVKRREFHTFLVLTKRPERMAGRMYNLDVPSNLWVGVSVTQQADVERMEILKRELPDAHKFVSFEPLRGSIDADLTGIEWVIIGAESGNRKGKIVPDHKWIPQLIIDSHFGGKPVFIKDNVGWPATIKEFPEAMA